MAASGHRLVHGGDRLRRPTLVGMTIGAHLRDIANLAPRHNPAALAAIEAPRRLRPEPPVVAGFDTAFRANIACGSEHLCAARTLVGSVESASLWVPRAVARMGCGRAAEMLSHAGRRLRMRSRQPVARSGAHVLVGL